LANAKPEPYTLTDGGGMFLQVNADGWRWWRFRCYLPGTGKRDTLSLGHYPRRSAETRVRETRRCPKLVANGIDPCDNRQAEAVAREWFAKS
jgi:Arm DNA-binding domain